MGDVIDSTVMHINKGNALFAGESKLVCGKSKGSPKRGLSFTLVDYSPARVGWGKKVRGGDVALNCLLKTCLSLKHPLSCRSFKQLECMAKSRVSF